MATLNSMRRTYVHTTRTMRASQLAPDADFKAHFNMLLILAESGHRARHKHLDMRRLLTDYLILQERFAPRSRLEPQLIAVFGGIVGQRLFSTVRYPAMTIAVLRSWQTTLLHLAEPRTLGITPVSELREIEKQSTINKRELAVHERTQNTLALISALKERHGVVNPFKFAHRLILQRNTHIKYAKPLDREKHITEHFGHPLVELINTDVLISRVPLARALEEAMES